MPQLDHETLVGAYQHLENLPRASEALHTLRKISSLVKPIMRKREWRVGTLKEFFPDQQNLLGLNVDRGRSICLRLRHAGDNRQFLPLEDVIDTLLHELSHNVHGPHDEKFHALWNELRDEYMDLKLKGYTGEGFLSEGHRLGGRRVPMHELRRNARAEAEKRKALERLRQGSGQRVGGQPVLRGIDMRNVIADAVTRRINITKGCASGTTGADQASQDADRNGFRTKAEEDESNERAIVQALWELVEEEEARSVGVVPQHTSIPLDLTSENTPEGRQNKTSELGSRTVGAGASRPRSASPKRTTIIETRLGFPNYSSISRNGSAYRPQSRLISEDEARRRSRAFIDLTSNDKKGDEDGLRSGINEFSKPTRTPTTWSCETCTLVNPLQFLCCDACGGERTRSTNDEMLSTAFEGKQNSTTVPPGSETQIERMGWNCRKCGWWMEKNFWVCSNCGLLKDSSK